MICLLFGCENLLETHADLIATTDYNQPVCNEMHGQDIRELVLLCFQLTSVKCACRIQFPYCRLEKLSNYIGNIDFKFPVPNNEQHSAVV